MILLPSSRIGWSITFSLHIQIAPVHSACLSLVYTFVYLEKQCFYEISANEEGEKKVLLSLSPSDFTTFFLYLTFWFCWRCKRKSHISSLLVCSRTQRTCTGLAVLRSSLGWTSIEARQALITERSCCVVLTSLWDTEKNLFTFTLDGFSAPEGSLQESACSITVKETAMKNRVELWK